MSWSIILKSLLMLTVKQQMKQKVKQVSREELYANVVYLPLIYLLTAAPTLLILLGVSLFVTAGVAQFFTQYTFPTDFVIVLASISTLMSAVIFWVYCVVLKQLLRPENERDIVTTAHHLSEKVQGAFAPIVNQIKQEQSMIKDAFVEKGK